MRKKKERKEQKASDFHFHTDRFTWVLCSAQRYYWPISQKIASCQRGAGSREQGSDWLRAEWLIVLFPPAAAFFSSTVLVLLSAPSCLVVSSLVSLFCRGTEQCPESPSPAPASLRSTLCLLLILCDFLLYLLFNNFLLLLSLSIPRSPQHVPPLSWKKSQRC